MNKDRLSVLIPDGESSLVLPVLYCLSQIPHLKVNILSSDPKCSGRFSRYRASYTGYDESQLKYNDDRKIELICDTIKKTGSTVVLSVDQPTIKLIATHNEPLARLSAVSPIPSRKMFETVIDKWRFANFLAENDIPAPASVLCQGGGEFEQNITKLCFPVLIKPTQGEGGAGIKFFDNLSELKLYLEKEGQPQTPTIVQSFINGYDIDCSVLCMGGRILAYTIQKGFISNKDAFGPPAGVDFLYDDQVFVVVQKLMKALNWSGVAHIDLRYDEDEKQPKVIEINPRFWGSLVGSLLAGVNFPYLACLTSVGADFPIPEYQFKRYVNIKARVGLLKQRFLQGNTAINPWVGETGIQFILKDPLPEIHKFLFVHKRN